MKMLGDDFEEVDLNGSGSMLSCFSSVAVE